VTTNNPATRDLGGEVHIWLARPDPIDDPELLSFYESILSDEELARRDRFVGKTQRHLFLVSHALVRTSLSRYSDTAPESWRFSEGEHGRPEIESPLGQPRLRFNLSHTHGLVACAVCHEIDCGVDVERLHRVRDLNGVARRVFAESERADLDAQGEPARQGRFTDYWSLKEAYIKARGMGFQLPPKTFAVRLGDGGKGRCNLVFDDDFDDRAPDWQIALYPIDPALTPEFRLAIALRTAGKEDLEIVVREVTPGV
jgi:4'-phosphopantetheinyl transferase